MALMTTDPFVPQPRVPASDYNTRPARSDAIRPADPYDPNLRTITVRDQHQMLEFDGRLIGFGSTENDKSTRWTEIEIFATKGGNYVVHRVGASVLYHKANSNCTSGTLTRVSQLDANEIHEPCDVCKPGRLKDLDGTDRVRRESDRHSADAVESTEALVQALSLKRPNGSTFLSAVAREALTDAAEHDDRIAGLTHQKVHIS